MDSKKDEKDYAPQELEFLDPKALRVSKISDGIYKAAVSADKSYDRVHFVRSFPESLPNEFIEMWDDEHAVAMLRNLAEVEKDSLKLIQEALERKYFRPKIDKILSLRVEFGFQVWQVQTDKGQIEFTVSQPQENIHRRGGGRILIKDADNNVFEIPNWRSLDANSRAWLEART